jgi:hypothetical protein
MTKLKISLIATSGVLVSGLGSAVLFNGIAHGEWDLPGLNQQVQHVTEVTQNHEARITNLENQASTPTGQPTPTPQVVTKVVTEQAPTATPVSTVSTGTVAGVSASAVAAPTVTKTEHLLCAQNFGNHPVIKLIVTTYSDGTSTWTDENGSAYTSGGCQFQGSW